jgi:hypothetical protein
MYARAFWLGPTMIEGMKQVPTPFFVVFYLIIAAIIAIIVIPIVVSKKKKEFLESKPE